MTCGERQEQTEEIWINHHAAFNEKRNYPSNHQDTCFSLYPLPFSFFYAHLASSLNFNYWEIRLGSKHEVLKDRHQHSEGGKLARRDCNKFQAGVRQLLLADD